MRLSRQSDQLEPRKPRGKAPRPGSLQYPLHTCRFPRHPLKLKPDSLFSKTRALLTLDNWIFLRICASDQSTYVSLSCDR